jgi:hypothetical protein
MQPSELKDSVDTLSSSAAEGQLLAGDVVQDRTKTTFARARFRELGDTVDHEGEKLSDAEAEPAIAADKREAVRLASKISEALGTVRVAPDDHRSAQATATQLGELAKQAQSLSERL